MNDNNKPCRYTSECNAPFCPERNNVDGIWFPSEAICRRKCFASMKLIKNQKKINKKSIYRDFFFTWTDLENIKRVTTKTKGRNPDKDITQCTTQNYPEFNKKTLAKVGVSDITGPQTSNYITDNQNPVKTPIRHD